MWKRKCHFLKNLSRCAQLFSKNYQPITLKFCNYLDYRWLNRLTLSFFAYICWLFFQDFFHFNFFFSIFENENTHINIYSLFIKKQRMSLQGPVWGWTVLKIWSQSVHKWRRNLARSGQKVWISEKIRRNDKNAFLLIF